MTKDRLDPMKVTCITTVKLQRHVRRMSSVIMAEYGVPGKPLCGQLGQSPAFTIACQ